jgi:aminoglycoside 3-N-acetyltransferase I
MRLTARRSWLVDPRGGRVAIDARVARSVTTSAGHRVERLGAGDRELARQTFALMAAVFGTAHASLSDDYLDLLLARSEFWAFAALSDGVVVGGLTAHTLPMTTFEGAEVFLYDIAVHPDYQRRGFGQRLVETLRSEAAAQNISMVFVPAEDEDTHALDFYRAIGGVATKVTIFEFGEK